MKRVVYVLLFLSLNNVYSQNSSFKWGFQGGINYSKLYGYELPNGFEYLYEKSPGIAFLAGFNLELQLGDDLFFKSDLVFERKSQFGNSYIELTDMNGFTQSYLTNIEQNFNYIVLTPILKYYFSDENSFYLNGGPFVGYLLNANFTNDLNRDDISNNDDVTSMFKNLDYGVTLGIGKTFDLYNDNSIFVELRNNLGLSNISKLPIFEGGTNKTNSVNLIFGYTFNN